MWSICSDSQITDHMAVSRRLVKVPATGLTGNYPTRSRKGFTNRCPFKPTTGHSRALRSSRLRNGRPFAILKKVGLRPTISTKIPSLCREKFSEWICALTLTH